MSRARWALVTVCLLGAALLIAPSAKAAFKHNPVIFVHGFSGSGAQFETQKMRFTSNRYPASYVTAFDWDSTLETKSEEELFAEFDALVEAMKQRTGKDQVDLVGHSRGTTFSHGYLAYPERAANIEHYVNIDGRTADEPPGGVDTLAIWAGREQDPGEPEREIVGARNVTHPNQTHVEAATSKETFGAMYRFLTGRSPRTVHILRDADGVVEVGGRALFFPINEPIHATGVHVWALDESGHRVGAAPHAALTLDADGNWGPVELETDRRYEFELQRPSVGTLHYYYEPFVHDDSLVRLLYSEPVEAILPRGPAHQAGLILRYKELWGDQGGQSDILEVNGVNVCVEVICPIEKRVNAVFVDDFNLDQRTDLGAPHPVLSQLSFITGADVFMPASLDASGTTTISLRSRGEGPKRTVAVPDFAALSDGFNIYLNDWETAVDRCLSRSRVRVSKGRISDAKLGRVRGRQRERLLALRLGTRRGVDRYCLPGGKLRIAYRRVDGGTRRAAALTSSSRRSAIAGIHPGDRGGDARRRLRGATSLRVDGSRWLVAPARRGGVLRVVGLRRPRIDTVREVGLAKRSLTNGGDKRTLHRVIRRIRHQRN